MRSSSSYQPGTPEGPLPDDGPLVRVVAYVPQGALDRFDEVVQQQGLSRSAAIVDAMGWWHVRKRIQAVRSSVARSKREKTPEQRLREAEEREMAVWRALMDDARQGR